MRYDLVLLDAFDHEYIPEHLLTREFLLEVRDLLSERGVLAANTFAGSRLYHFESATYHSAFGDFYRLKSSNRVILVRLGGLPDRAELARNAGALEDRLAPFGVGKEWLLPRFEVESGWPPNTRVLTDQYSPSNLLNGSN
jgi:spermidine synthase